MLYEQLCALAGGGIHRAPPLPAHELPAALGGAVAVPGGEVADELRQDRAADDRRRPASRSPFK